MRKSKRTALGCLHGENGQGLAEYALLIGLIALVVIIAVGLLGRRLSLVFWRINLAFWRLLRRNRPIIGTPIPYPYPPEDDDGDEDNDLGLSLSGTIVTPAVVVPTAIRRAVFVA